MNCTEILKNLKFNEKFKMGSSFSKVFNCDICPKEKSENKLELTVS